MSGADIMVISEPLPVLAEKIKVSLRDTERTAGAAVEHALTTGRLLIEAKAQVPYGEWESWLTASCAVAPRTARAYMRLAEKWPTIQNGNGVADLPLREVMKAIGTSPTAPPRHPTYVRVQSLDKRDRIADAITKAAGAQRALVRNIKKNFIKRVEVERLRTKLQAALAALDELQAEGGAA